MNGTLLPKNHKSTIDNPTNGDVQKAILSDFEFKDSGDTITGERFDPYCHLQFSREWWDAPYKGQKKNS